MSNFNKVILVGNLTRDPELRYSKSGTPVGRIRMAVNRTHLSKDGEKKKETSFFNVSSFGRKAEILTQYLEKGHPILVDGRLHSYTWQDDKGNKRYEVEVIMEDFKFLPRSNSAKGNTAKAS